MPIAPFELERFFAQHEFSTPYLLCASDCEAMSKSSTIMSAKESGQPGWFADMMVELFDNLRAGKDARVTDRVERVTGRPPRSFGEFARDLAAGQLAHA